MRKLLFLLLILPGTLQAYADSYLLKAEKGIEAKIDEDTFGSNGDLIIYNKGNETVEVLLLKKKPEPETRGPLTLQQFDKISLSPGEKRSVRVFDIKSTIYGIGVINKSNGKPYEIHGFKWPK